LILFKNGASWRIQSKDTTNANAHRLIITKIQASSPSLANTITLNGTTTGGKTVGSYCHLVAISATRWWVEGVFLTATETQATPFS